MSADARRARSSSIMRAGCSRSTTRSCIWPNRGCPSQTLRIGIPADYRGPGAGAWPGRLPRAAGRMSGSTCAPTVSTCMLRDLRQGEFDGDRRLVQYETAARCPASMDRATGLGRGANTQLHEDRPVPLVAYGESCLTIGSRVAALEQGRASITRSCLSRLGVSPAWRLRCARASASAACCAAACALAGLMVWQSAPLPQAAGRFLRHLSSAKASIARCSSNSPTRSRLRCICERNLPAVTGIVSPDIAPVEDVARPVVR